MSCDLSVRNVAWYTSWGFSTGRDYLFIGTGQFVQTLETYWVLPFWIITRSHENIGAANLNNSENTVRGGQGFQFPHFFLKFRSIFLIFSLKLYLFSSSFWPSGWASRPPGKALATPLNTWHNLHLNEMIIYRFSPLQYKHVFFLRLVSTQAYKRKCSFLCISLLRRLAQKCTKVYISGIRKTRWIQWWPQIFVKLCGFLEHHQ